MLTSFHGVYLLTSYPGRSLVVWVRGYESRDEDIHFVYPVLKEGGCTGPGFAYAESPFELFFHVTN